MPTKTNNADPGRIDDDLTATELFAVLADRRRRDALHYLARKAGAVPVGDVADQIALWEGDHTRDGYERACTSLVHCHLPKLEETGLVRYDRDGETVELRDCASQVTPFLELAAPLDVR